MKITLFKDIKDINNPYHTTLKTALRRIQQGKSKSLIDKVRAGDKSKKKQLPIVCFSGEFSSRNDDALFEHSGYIVLDFDHVDVDQVKTALAVDDYVYSCWTSPSGDGVKALVAITNPERHRDHFRALKTYFDKQYCLEIDESGVNESRACFESYDPNIIIKDESKKFGAFTTEMAEAQVPVNESYKHTDYMKLNLAARMVRRAEDGEKHSTLLKASLLCGGYIAAGRIEEEEAIRVLVREICKRDIDSEIEARATIIRGIEKGKTMPIREVIDEEQAIKREMLINDGDMSFISSDDEDFRWIDDYAQGKIPLGLTTGDENLDKYFKYKREFVIINGHSNVGKTTAALYLICNAARRHDWKWVIYSSENRTASVKMQLMQYAIDKKIDHMSYAERKYAYKWVNEYFTIINTNQVYSYSDLILFMDKIKRQTHIDAVFIDPYNSLKIEISTSRISSHEYHYGAASEFLTYAKTNDVAVWLNMHAVTEAQRRKGDDGLPVAPYAEDTEGGGKFVNRADCFLTFHRKIQSPDHDVRKMTEVHIRKVRETETGGQPTPIEEPYLMYMNLSHTGFKGWFKKEPLFASIKPESEQKPIDFSGFKL